MPIGTSSKWRPRLEWFGQAETVSTLGRPPALLAPELGILNHRLVRFLVSIVKPLVHEKAKMLLMIGTAAIAVVGQLLYGHGDVSKKATTFCRGAPTPGRPCRVRLNLEIPAFPVQRK
jgi:hypothetical protein